MATAQIVFDIPPLSLAAGVTDEPCEIANYQFELPPDAANELRKQVFSLQSKLSESSNAAALEVLENADFELFGQPLHERLGLWATVDRENPLDYAAGLPGTSFIGHEKRR